MTWEVRHGDALHTDGVERVGFYGQRGHRFGDVFRSPSRSDVTPTKRYSDALALVLQGAQYETVFSLTALDPKVRKQRTQRGGRLHVRHLPALQWPPARSTCARDETVAAEKPMQKFNGIRFDLFHADALAVRRLSAVVVPHPIRRSLDPDGAVRVDDAGTVGQFRFGHAGSLREGVISWGPAMCWTVATGTCSTVTRSRFCVAFLTPAFKPWSRRRPTNWGLRDYGTPPRSWGGDPGHAHEWGALLPAGKEGPGNRCVSPASSLTNPEYHHVKPVRIKDGGAFCACGAWRGHLGLEPTPDLYVEHLVEVFRELRRVLAGDGTLWLNLGDCYATDAPGASYGWTNGKESQRDKETKKAYAHVRTGLPAKNLVGIPWRVAFALQADGWWLRSDIVWAKPNPMPESVTDRPTKAHEYLFLLTKAERYYYDAEAIKERASEGTHERRAKYASGKKPVAGWATGSGDHSARGHARAKGGTRKLADEGSGIKNNQSFDAAMAVMPEWRNKRSVWTIVTEAFPEAHFATFPQALVEPCILAGSRPGDLVLDPFAGSCTVGVVALRHGRRFLGLELNPVYVEMGRRRIAGPLFAAEPTA